MLKCYVKIKQTAMNTYMPGVLNTRGIEDFANKTKDCACDGIKKSV